MSYKNTVTSKDTAAQIKEAFLKLEDFELDFVKGEKQPDYLAIEEKDGNIIFTIDPSKTYVQGNPAEDVEAMAEALRSSGIEDIKITNQFRKFLFRNADYKDGKLKAIAVPYGVDEELHEENFNDPDIQSGDVNYAKLQVTIPNEHDSVVKLQSALKHSVVERAKTSINQELAEAEEMLKTQLGKRGGEDAMKDVLADLGLSKTDKSIAG